jgi:sarcosine oxidase
MPLSFEFETIVLGLGAMGSAAVAHLARRGQSVLGLDQFSPPHTLGSSHGQTRIIREAYFENPAYVPLVQRAYVLWDELARERNTRLFCQTGGLMLGRPESVVVAGALRSAREHGLPHEVLSAGQIRQRFPVLHPGEDMIGVLEPRAGILFPEKCVAAHLDVARQHGATLRCNEPVLRCEPVAPAATSGGDGRVRVMTSAGQYEARRLIVTAGAWVTRLFPELALPFRVERQVLFWFEPRAQADAFAPERCPIYLCELEPGRHFYGFPEMGEGVKVARHHEGETADPDHVRREVGVAEVDDMRSVLQQLLPDANGALRQTTVCLYTNTPDEHFWLDQHPHHPQIFIASPCSGHGFKFSSAIGEVLADWATDREPRLDLRLFRARDGNRDRVRGDRGDRPHARATRAPAP